MLRVLRDLLWWRYQTPSTHAFRLPPLQRTQERGTHCVADADEIKSLGHPPPVVGTNSCWWNGSGMEQYPTVQGSTWTVGRGGAGHDQYGLDTVGYGMGVVNLIQTQGGPHGIQFPCTINIHQSINYDGIDLYVTNLLTQTISSTTVNVCRAGVCSGTIPY